MTDTPRSALSVEEYEEQSIERKPDHKHDLEAASMERNGTLNVWNQAGHTVEIQRKNKDAVISLLMAGTVNARHMNALIEATGDDAIKQETREALGELFEEITRYAPPPTRPNLRVNRGTAALMWTMTPELRITSCTGNAKDFMRESDRELLANSPDLWTVLATTDAEHPIIAAHLKALAGEVTSFKYEGKLPWEFFLSPVVENEAVIGVVGYANLLEGELPQERKAEEAAYILTDASGTILHSKGDVAQVTGMPIRPGEGIGRQTAELVHEYWINAVEQPKQFVRRMAQVMGSSVEETDRITLKDGRVLYRQMQPLKDSMGNVIARAWVMTQAAAKRATTVAAVLLLALGLTANLTDGDPDDDPTEAPVPITATLSIAL
jgi:hypothetical protein